MSRDMGHLYITYNKDIAQQYLIFNLTRKCVTVVMYLIISIFRIYRSIVGLVLEFVHSSGD